MGNFNKVILLGNLTRDPELRYTPKGTAVARLGLAVNRSYKSETGETKEEVTFIDIDAWGKQAEVIGQYLRKGRQLFVEGRLKLDQWDDKNTGQKMSKLRVVMENFQFVDARGEGGAPGAPGAPGAAPAAPSAGSPPAAARSSRPATAPTEGAEPPPPELDDVPF
jgi:single-strand DNA-binding protein